MDNIVTGLDMISPLWRPAILFIAILMPIWYMAIYLFHKNFYEKSTQLIRWIFCFCLSLVWFAACAFFSLFKTLSEINKPTLPSGAVVPLLNSPVDEYYFLAGWISIFVLLFVIGTNYFFGNKKRTMNFPLMVVTWLGTMVIIFVVIILIFYRR